MKPFLLILGAALLAGACGGNSAYVRGTKIAYTKNNESVLRAVEDYRLALERGDADALMLMAHKEYWEDSGTPSGSDDYGYEGLRNVLTTRFGRASEIRYTMRYMTVSQQCKEELSPGCRATVDVIINASYTIQDVHGNPVRADKRDQNQLFLEWNGQRWLFIAGM
ncbi:MAG TPA: hypothetical protein VM513_31275 [Kofleriaceae bacterium]|nr:hypothetical protein [Kofleriaceae bacterium]